MLEMLNTADVCAGPDEYNEMNDKSTMNKIMEYMSLGKPIVQFDLTEGRVSAQEASLYARRNDSKDLAQKIVELLESPASDLNGQLLANCWIYHRDFARGGALDGSAKHRRIRAATVGSVIAERTLIRPPHFGQQSAATSKTR